MESPTCFDLETAIGQWRTRLAAESGITPSIAAELEEHLRTAVVDLEIRGLSLREAFQVAAQRLGAPPVLAVEFRRADRAELWRGRILWMAIGSLLLQFWGSISSGLLLFAGSPTGATVGRYANLTTLYIVPSVAFWALMTLVAVLLASGKGFQPAERLSFLLVGRIRFVLGAGMLAGMFSVIQGWLNLHVLSHSYGSESPETYLLYFLMGFAYKLPLILLIAWLMPRRFQRPRGSASIA